MNRSNIAPYYNNDQLARYPSTSPVGYNRVPPQYQQSGALPGGQPPVDPTLLSTHEQDQLLGLINKMRIDKQAQSNQASRCGHCNGTGVSMLQNQNYGSTGGPYPGNDPKNIPYNQINGYGRQY